MSGTPRERTVRTHKHLTLQFPRTKRSVYLFTHSFDIRKYLRMIFGWVYYCNIYGLIFIYVMTLSTIPITCVYYYLFQCVWVCLCEEPGSVCACARFRMFGANASSPTCLMCLAWPRQNTRRTNTSEHAALAEQL